MGSDGNSRASATIFQASEWGHEHIEDSSASSCACGQPATFNKDVPDYLDETFHTFVFPLPLIEIRSLENVSDKKMRNRTHAHNNLAKLKNKLNELQITNVLLLDRDKKLRLILDGLIRG